MRFIGVFILLITILYINVCYGWSAKKIIYPYESACPDETPNVHQKEYPCNWDHEVLHWDMKPMIFLCNNVPTEYHITYNITSLTTNEYGYSVSIWEHFRQRTYYDDNNQEYTSEMYIDRYFNEWKNKAEKEWRMNEIKFVQPLNGDFAYDFSSDDRYMPLAVFNNGRTNNDIIGIYIDRETMTDLFPCFYFMIDISIL